MGPFAVEKGEDGTIANGLYAFYGASKTYYDYENSIFAASNGMYKVVTLEKYLAYSR